MAFRLAHRPRWWPLALGLAVAACTDPPVAGAGDAASDAAGSDGWVTLADGAVGKKLKVDKVVPARGGVAGGEQIDVSGAGFEPTARVLFGDREAEVEWRAGTTHVFVRAPAGQQPGLVPVTVINSKASQSVLHNAYLYASEVTVDGFAPAQGSMVGGTEITVRGSGFRLGDRVLVGYMEAAQSRFVDDKTLVAMTPPWLDTPGAAAGDLAKVQVSVRHGSGVTHGKGVFTYGRPPRVDSVAPAVVAVDGGAVTLKGAGLGNAKQVYANAALGVLAPGSAGSVRGATMPALLAVDPSAKPGPAELVVTGPFGNHKLFPAFAYVTAKGGVALYGASPSSGPTSGGNSIVLMASLPDGTSVAAVTIGGKPAPHKQNGALVEVSVPAGDAGAAAIALTTSAGDATLQGGYLYVPELKLDVIEPNLGPVEGGGKAQLRGKGFAPGCTVRIGMYTAPIKELAAKGNALDVIVPAGAPGAADVVLRCGSQEAMLPGGYGYMAGHARVNAVSPPSGSTGGSAIAKVYGSGLRPGVKVLFGAKPVPAMTFVHSGMVEVKTPPHNAGKVAVTVIDGDATDTLVDGYTYFSAATPDGGTWGEGVGGTLNVTVLNIYTRAPIEDATVQLGSPGEAIYDKYTGVTDAKGMVVFSGPDVVPPIRVSATKPQFTASSIVHFDAANATLLLFPYTPPSPGSGGGAGTPQPFALVKGKVVDLDKYLLVPPANCQGSTDQGDLTCQACAEPVDCTGTAAGGATFLCVDNGAAGKRCLPDCGVANACKKGFVCVPDDVAPGAKVCKPTLGIRKVYCATTVRDIDAEDDNPPPSNQNNGGALPYKTATADEQTGAFALTTRLDELAVVCIGGHVSNQSKKFVPTAMGVHRHVFPKPYFKDSDAITGIEIRLDIALKRTLQVRLDHPQKSFGGIPGSLSLKTWIDLGSDGLIRMPGIDLPALTVATVSDDIALPSQPVVLPKALTDSTYTYLAQALFGGSPQIGPVTLTLHEGVAQPGDVNARLRKPDGTATEFALGTDEELCGVVAGKDGSVLVLGARGGLWRGSPGEPQLVWLPPVTDVYAEPARMNGLSGTPVLATMVGAKGIIRRLDGTKVTVEAAGTGEELLAVCEGASGRVAVGAKGTIVADVGQGWQPIGAPTPSTLRAVVCGASGAVAVGDGGVVVEIATDGAPLAKATKQAAVDLHAIARVGDKLWIGGDKPAGDGPVLLAGQPGAWTSAWPPGTITPNFLPIRAIVAQGDGTVVVADRDGGQFRIDAAGVAKESGERLDLRPRAGARLPDGSVVLVGQPGLWLGPFLTVPVIGKPLPNAGLSGAVPVEWTAAPGPLPSFARVHLDGNLDPKEGWGFPFWWIYGGPDISDFLLPNFEEKGIEVFMDNPQVQYWVRIDRGYVPGFSINSFSTLDLEFGRWRSRATNTVKLGPK